MKERVDSAAKVIKVHSTKIYEAFTSPAAMESWLPPKGMTGTVLSFAFHEGGGYRLRLTYDMKTTRPERHRRVRTKLK